MLILNKENRDYLTLQSQKATVTAFVQASVINYHSKISFTLLNI